MGTYGTGTLAGQVATAIHAGMVIQVDRGSAAHPRFAAKAATGAQLCWHAKANAVLPVRERDQDASLRSQLVAAPDQRRRQEVLTARVIEWTVESPGRLQAESVYRLVTTIPGPELAPAHEGAAPYSERWEFEAALDELKTPQRGLRPRSASKGSVGGWIAAGAGQTGLLQEN